MSPITPNQREYFDFRLNSVNNVIKLNCPYLRNEVLANLVKNINLGEFIALLKKYPVFSKIGCNLNSLTYCKILDELEKAGKIKYTMVCEDKRSGPNLEKFLEIDGVSVNHNPHLDAAGPLESERYYQVVLELYKELKNINDVESLLKNPISVEIIYK